MRVVWTEGAADDLAAIVEHIAQEDSLAARRVAKTIFDGVLSLCSMPNRGRRRRTDQAREMVFAPWPYLALYEVMEETVVIRAIRHTSRNWRD